MVWRFLAALVFRCSFVGRGSQLLEFFSFVVFGRKLFFVGVLYKSKNKHNFYCWKGLEFPEMSAASRCSKSLKSRRCQLSLRDPVLIFRKVATVQVIWVNWWNKNWGIKIPHISIQKSTMPIFTQFDPSRKNYVDRIFGSFAIQRPTSRLNTHLWWQRSTRYCCMVRSLKNPFVLTVVDSGRKRKETWLYLFQMSLKNCWAKIVRNG